MIDLIKFEEGLSIIDVKNKSQLIQHFCQFFVVTEFGVFYRKDKVSRWEIIKLDTIKKEKRLKDLFDEWFIIANNPCNWATIVWNQRLGDVCGENGYLKEINMWSGFLIQPTMNLDGMVVQQILPWLSHIYNIWASKNIYLFHEIMKIFFAIFRQPCKRTKTNVAIRTSRNSPLSSDCWETIFKPFQKILPNEHIELVFADNLLKGSIYNKLWARSIILIVHINDSKITERQMKFLENDTMTVNSKIDDPFTMKNMCNIFLCGYYSSLPTNKFRQIEFKINDNYFHNRLFIDQGFLNRYFNAIVNTNENALFQFLISYPESQLKSIQFNRF